MFGRSHHRERNLCPGYVVRIIHFSQSKTGFQQAHDCLINVFLIDLTCADSLYQCLVTGATLQVRTVQHSGSRSRLGIRIRLMPMFIIEIGNGPAVGKDDTVEAPIVAKDLHQQTVAATTRFSLKTIIGTHHLLHFGLFHQSLKGRQIGFIQIARTEVLYVERVAVPLGSGVYGEVLGTSMQLVIFSIVRTLQTFYNHHTHTAGEIRILTVGFDAAAPTRVTIDIHCGRPHGKPLITRITSL